jgi:PAS domain S-box-containing protein
LHDPQGRVIAGIETVRDITARKLGELQRLRQLEAIEASIDGIAILDANGEYLHLNQAHAEIYGYPTADELLGRGWHILYSPQERQRLESLIFNSLAQNGGWRGEALGLKKDGTGFPQEISLTALEDGGMICVVRDISERKQAEEKIQLLNDNLTRQAQDLQIINRDLEAFNYSLAHDLRSPLTAISLASQHFAEICADSLDNTGRLLLDSILRGCDQIDELIEAMLELFKVSRHEMVQKPVDLSALADEILADLSLRHPERQAEWRVDGGMSAPCDPHLVRILLENLIGNAWKYTSGRTLARIEFGLDAGGTLPKFFVRDNGAGFDMREAGKLFQPFQRLHRSSDFPGTGIGLATVQRIIDRHGGRIWAAGECDQGATFFFTLPLADEFMFSGESAAV